MIFKYYTLKKQVRFYLSLLFGNISVSIFLISLNHLSGESKCLITSCGNAYLKRIYLYLRPILPRLSRIIRVLKPKTIPTNFSF